MCVCGTAYTETADGRHWHRLLNGHSPSPASATPVTGTRWEDVGRITPNLRKGRRTPR